MKVSCVGSSKGTVIFADSHVHSEYELCLNYYGNGVTVVGGDVSAHESGSIYLCPPGVTHSKRFGDMAFRDVFVKFTADNEYEDAYFKSFGKFMQDGEDKPIEKLLFIMYSFFEQDPEKNEAIIVSLLNSVLLILGQNKSKCKSLTATSLANIINNNFTDSNFDIENAISTLHYSKDYIRRRFKEEYGISPVKYLNKLRVEHAVKLILSRKGGEPKFPDIAHMCGFCDYVYFTRVFKKYTGLSPSAVV